MTEVAGFRTKKNCDQKFPLPHYFWTETSCPAWESQLGKQELGFQVTLNSS